MPGSPQLELGRTCPQGLSLEVADAPRQHALWFGCVVLAAEMVEHARDRVAHDPGPDRTAVDRGQKTCHWSIATGPLPLDALRPIEGDTCVRNSDPQLPALPPSIRRLQNVSRTTQVPAFWRARFGKKALPTDFGAIRTMIVFARGSTPSLPHKI